MSLELIASVEKALEEPFRLSVVNSIVSAGFNLVYELDNYTTNGFTIVGTHYKSSQPPLFELIFQPGLVSLSVYGDLNELSRIREIVYSIFISKDMEINLQEE